MKLFTTALLIGFTFIACKQEGGFDKSETGLLYKLVTVNKDKSKAQVGDLLTMEVVYKTENDSECMNTFTMKRPVRLLLKEATFKGSLDEGFAMMSEGDSAIFKVSADSFYVNFLGSELPKEIQKGSLLTFYIKLKEVKGKAEVEKEQNLAMEQRQKMLDSLKIGEDQIFKKYIADNKITIKPTSTGIYFMETIKGKGKQAEKGKTVKVNYTGKLLSGQMFDTSIEENAKKGNIFQEGRPYQPIEFTIGAQQVIPGWDEAISMMKEGGKASFILPSQMAYGDQGAGPIPPFSPLKFEVELIEVK